ncbi:hypothetical protein [Phthorimaea operculella granulovirus]|uniref:Uncharacterized protein n=1 Tax=Phthorimaea operculella granulovirus TaxID=192584 RepID=Q8JS33_9BBAC|nr:hypothetical protein [Phthorimaea operculella granulovirus]AAM70224.1 hypothetical protein [Phthorimaea operculella granulovirus]ANY57415.1 hypothetical protein PhopGVgp026 [Phthorimaea operculella granulovirus]QBH65861.1 hypothetical protein PhopGVgp026 [Phthorimaea operculella granulovirus]QBH65991.1 hypothetical protein PhopGVgp026 [Phthorimaea operculella granulovirus]QBH66121.1 hypothetical protein PhopGVgp026 [Phthorimaea operculella granulovirus]
MSVNPTIEDIMEALEEAMSTVENDTIKMRLKNILDRCEKAKIVKRKTEGIAKKENKICLHVYCSTYRGGVLGFFVNSRQSPKPVSAAVEHNSKELATFTPALSITIGTKEDKKKFAVVMKNIRKLSCFYMYTNTKNKFRYVNMSHIKTSLETIGELCTKEGYEILCNNLDTIDILRNIN